jgi:hypothetical protein
MNGANIAHAQAGSPQALLDFSTPFDQTKLAILEQVIAAMYSPNRKDVSISCSLTDLD